MRVELDFNLLQVFDMLFHERSVTRAGERLHLSQPAISGSLSRLRRLFNDELFVRNHGEMTPTPRALALALPVRETLDRMRLLMRPADQFDLETSTRTFTIMGADFFPHLIAARLAEVLQAQAPGVTIHFIDNATGPIPELLDMGRVSLALDVQQSLVGAVRLATLVEQDLVVAVASGNAIVARRSLAPYERFPLELLCSLPHAMRSVFGVVTGPVDSALAELGRKRRVLITLPTFAALCDLVGQTDLVALIPNGLAQMAHARFGLRTFALPSEIRSMRHTLMMYWGHGSDADAGHAWLRNEVRRIMEPSRPLSNEGSDGLAPDMVGPVPRPPPRPRKAPRASPRQPSAES